MKSIFLIVSAVAVLGLPALADGVITLELETPSLQSAQTQQTTPSNRDVTSVKGQSTENQQVGRVGLVAVDRSNIYAHPDTKTRVFSCCLKDVPLAIVTTSGSWYGVMMIDGSIGWIQTSKVKLLNYSVVTSTPQNPDPKRSSGYASRGDYDRSYDSADGNGIIQTAMQYMGVPYVYGGTSTTNGIDCSAFVRTVFAQHGVKLPRVARDQANVGTPVSWSDLQAGDRLYFACKHSYVDHCGIYMGNGYFIHASASRGGVSVDTLSKAFYSKNLVAAMRSI